LLRGQAGMKSVLEEENGSFFSFVISEKESFSYSQGTVFIILPV
jgi:hypothetical protein